jgi:hypothetical protein
MNKFDEHIKGAEDAYVPQPTFVDDTMKRIADKKPRRRFGFKGWAMAFAGTIAVVSIAFIAVPKSDHTIADSVSKQSGSHKVAEARTAESPTAISDGSDDASIARDLADVQGSLSQSGNDQAGADGSLDDQQIQIPTD